MNGILNFLKLKSFLENNDSIDRLYSALESYDFADAVMTAMDTINKFNHSFKKKVKCEVTSREIRLKGNVALHNGLYREALVYYNVALMFAPSNSESMILALSNRSELLLRFHAVDACLKDIKRCQTMKCSAEIIRKLKARKFKCMTTKSVDLFDEMEPTFAGQFFKFDTKRNKEFPCASQDVDVVKEDGVIKVIAARDIKLGEVVAIEPALVSTPGKQNYTILCYYCHKTSLTLIPCDGCCKALFCNEDCKEQCFKEYHKIECHIIDVIDSVVSTPKCKLSIVAALKFREMSDSWDDLIAYSLKIGKFGTKENCKSEPWYQANIRSALNFNDNKHFIHGKYFNECFVFAIIIKYLSEIPNYLPKDVIRKTESQRAVARLMLSLFLKFPSEFDIANCSSLLSEQLVGTLSSPNFGLFSFMSKLTHNCEPNLYCAGLGNKVALIALKSIKKGKEFTISLRGHWCETFYPGTRLKELFMSAEVKCQCRVCIQNWNPFTVDKTVLLSDTQKNYYDKLVLLMSSSADTSNGQQFSIICRALENFKDVGNTQEFKFIFNNFCRLIMLFQSASTRNTLI